MPVDTSKILELVLDHVGRSLEGLWCRADAPEDSGGPERQRTPRWAAYLGFLLAHSVLGWGAGPAQPLWS